MTIPMPTDALGRPLNPVAVAKTVLAHEQMAREEGFAPENSPTPAEVCLALAVLGEDKP